ncbi:MAG: hypothetical protein MUC49_14790 [Raineya sp.]|nr:hypothetical protein [Raineya sp.]
MDKNIVKKLVFAEVNFTAPNQSIEKEIPLDDKFNKVTSVYAVDAGGGFGSIVENLSFDENSEIFQSGLAVGYFTNLLREPVYIDVNNMKSRKIKLKLKNPTGSTGKVQFVFSLDN